MLRQAEEFRTVNISGGAGGSGGRGGEQGGSGGAGEGPTTHFGVVNADTMHLVIQNHWSDYASFRPVGVGSSGGASHGSDGAGNIRDGSDSSLFTQRVDKRHGGRLNDDDEIEIIPSKNLKLIREIGSGPGYFLHAGQNQGHAVIVRVFNRGPSSTVRRQLEPTVALFKGIMHPNLLRLLGISPPESCSHFIVYENVHWQNAEGPLAMALKTDLKRSITIGFKMVAGLSAGLNYLLVQGIFVGEMGVQNFDIFLDVDDRFVISVHPRLPDEGDAADCQDAEDIAWMAFNALCNKTLTSANRVLHNEEILRDPAILDFGRAASEKSMSPSPSSSQNTGESLDVPPRREYVWRTKDRGRQSLENIARKISLDLDLDFLSLSRINRTDGRTPHRCAGYVREEITLATTTLDSAVVAHDAPSASERCLICREVVDLREEFRCECGDPAPGTRHTVKCQECKFWSHSDCVENSNHKFLCRLCIRPEAPAEEEETWASGSPILFGPRTPTAEEEDIDIETRTSGPPLLFGSRTPTEDSEEDMNTASTIRTPAIPSRSLSRHGSFGPAFETVYEKPETSELSTVIDQKTEEEARQFREAQDKDKDGAKSVGIDSRSASTNKRRKRGARKGKGGSQASLSPEDEILENLATASLALAHEISRASRASSQKSNTTHSSTRNGGRPFEPVAMYAVPVAWLDSVSPVPPLPKLHQYAKTQTPKPALAPAPPAVISGSTPAASITKKPSTWKLSFGKSSAAALGRISPVDESPPDTLVLPMDMHSTRAASPNSALGARTTWSSASSIMSGNWPSSMSTTSSAGTSTSAFTRYNNASVRSVSTTMTATNSWRTPASKPHGPPKRVQGRFDDKI
ncbi:Kinase-like protein [Mycena sanguinolenta]|uniref:Kinase-like protein n=1 Tax=Mycena sanguinolenta TaxID=230812 RepID=A0A8H7D3Y1_9AGAR|nr:Kinase-like protein [Mycena sanguinolenta]